MNGQRVIDIYDFMRAALELCEVEVIEAHRSESDAEILAVVAAMAGDFGEWWQAFRHKWGIPDYPLQQDILRSST